MLIMIDVYKRLILLFPIVNENRSIFMCHHEDGFRSLNGVEEEGREDDELDETSKRKICLYLLILTGSHFTQVTQDLLIIPCF